MQCLEGGGLPCLLPAEPAITSHMRLGGTRADSTDFSFYRKIRLKKSGTSGAAGRRAARAMQGEVARLISRQNLSLLCFAKHSCGFICLAL